MPTLNTRGAASARGFGLFSGKPKVLTNENFYSSTTWVAPAGVTTVTVNMGGPSGSAANWSNFLMGPAGYYTSSTAPTAASARDACQAWLNNATPLLNAGAPGERTVYGAVGQISYTLSNGDTVNVNDSQVFYGGYARTIRGTFAGVLEGSTAIVNHPFKRFFNYVQGNTLELFNECSQGYGQTIAFGVTANAGQCPNPTGQTFSFQTNVSPGSSYNFQISYGGYVFLTYLL